MSRRKLTVRALIVNEEPRSTTELAFANCGKQSELRKLLPRKILIDRVRRVDVDAIDMQISGGLHRGCLSLSKGAG
jgi:hypothetical protein